MKTDFWQLKILTTDDMKYFIFNASDQLNVSLVQAKKPYQTTKAIVSIKE